MFFLFNKGTNLTSNNVLVMYLSLLIFSKSISFCVLKSKIPLDKFGDPNDVANTVLFLCSDLSDYITGETIHVNGGMYFS